MVTLPLFVTRISWIVVAIFDTGNKNSTRYLQQSQSDATTLKLMERLAVADERITERDSRQIAALKAAAAAQVAP